MCIWDSNVGRCSFLNGSGHIVDWSGGLEVGQTHVVKAVDETQHAPRVIAHREAELLFIPDGSMRKLGVQSKTSVLVKSVQKIEALGTVYFVKDSGTPILDASAQRLLDGSNSVFSLPNDVPNLSVVVDLNSLRLVDTVSVVLHGDTALDNAWMGLRYDDGHNQEEDGEFHMPSADWAWHDIDVELLANDSADMTELDPPALNDCWAG